jgi:hypothetical protein
MKPHPAEAGDAGRGYSGDSGGDSAIDLRPPRGNRLGRKKGVPNKFTRQIKEAVLDAVELSKYSNGEGLVGYLKWLSEEHPRTFARSLLGRLLPIQVRLRGDVVARTESVAELRQQLAAKGIPIDRLTTLFEVPRVPEPRRPSSEPDPPRDEDGLDREPADRASEPNGLDRAHEPSRRRYGAGEPARDVREHEVAILSPSLGGWHALGEQLDLPIDEKEPTDDDPPQAAE